MGLRETLSYMSEQAKRLGDRVTWSVEDDLIDRWRISLESVGPDGESGSELCFVEADGELMVRSLPAEEDAGSSDYTAVGFPPDDDLDDRLRVCWMWNASNFADHIDDVLSGYRTNGQTM